jgi:hypothetical protein
MVHLTQSSSEVNFVPDVNLVLNDLMNLLFPPKPDSARSLPFLVAKFFRRFPLTIFVSHGTQLGVLHFKNFIIHTSMHVQGY